MTYVTHRLAPGEAIQPPVGKHTFTIASLRFGPWEENAQLTLFFTSTVLPVRPQGRVLHIHNERNRQRGKMPTHSL